MLVENKNLTGKVVSIKLTTGEEIIARVVEDNVWTNGSLRVLAPLSMVLVPGDTPEQAQVAFAPWVLGVDESMPIDIKSTSMIFYAVSREDAAKQYAAALGQPEYLGAPLAKEAPMEAKGSRGGRR